MAVDGARHVRAMRGRDSAWTMEAVADPQGEQVVAAATAGLTDEESLRPDLPIPLAPLGEPAATFREWVIGLRQPAFRHAKRITVVWAVAVLVVLVGSRTIVVSHVAVALVGLASAMAAYILVRTAALAIYERQQRRFEPLWLRRQTEALRASAFEVVRFTLEGVAAPMSERVFDLTDPDDVRTLLRQQDAERKSGTPSRGVIEFVYPAAAGQAAVETVKRALSAIEFRTVGAGRLNRGKVRFPGARYMARA